MALAAAGFLLLFYAASLIAAPELLPDEPPVGEDEREHWSFRPLQPVAVPVLENADWCRTPIDNFVLFVLRKKQLEPAPEASRATILRRLSFDLTGLPPTPEEIAEFVADKSPDAYERQVDRLLASPAYGEKWGQYWLDLARFAETDGFEHDLIRPLAWQYRDWVVSALNDDMPYDQFIRWQIAGDEIASENVQARCATAFCLAGPDMPDVNSQEERRHLLLNEITSTVGSAILGLQFGCAQCHDHKYDPISIGDFYRLRAFFDPAVKVTKNKSVTVLQNQTGESNVSRVYLRGDWRNPGPELKPAFPRIANAWNDELPDDAASSGRGRRAALANWLTRPDHPLTSRVMANRLWQHHFGRGLSQTPSDFGVMGDEPLFLELLNWLAGEFIRSEWSLKSMHRLIVTSATYRQSSNGSEGSPSELAAFQRTLEADPENRYLGRFDRRRLTGEEIRDAMFCASSSLEYTRGGIGVMPPLPAELMQTLLKGQWTVSSRQSDHYRRSIYIFARRNLRYPIFEVFDRPDGNASCPERNRSTTAPQSLHLLNSETSLDAARRLAGVILSESTDPRDQISQAFVRVLGREPSSAELDELVSFLNRQKQLLRSEKRHADRLALPIPNSDQLEPVEGAALTDLCLALFNLNEFVYVD